MNQSFSTTRWTLVLDAAKAGTDESRPALEVLCRQYWEPLYAFVLRTGCSQEDAKDSTQAFFEYLLESNLPARAAPGLGRFRSFLLKTLKNFLATEVRESNRQKRGISDYDHFSMDEFPQLREEVHAAGTPESAFDRKWAHTLLNLALDQLAAQQKALGNEERFEAMRPLLLSPQRGASEAKELAREFGLSESNIRTSLFRLRLDFRDLVRAEVAKIVDDPADIDDEITYLLKALKE